MTSSVESTTSTTFSPTEGELGLVAQIYVKAGCSRPGFIEKDTVVDIVTSSVNLPPNVFSTIWGLVDEKKSEYLSETGVAIALRLIGWAQSGEEVNDGLLNRSGPLAQITLGPTEADADWPTFTENERDASQKLFEECGPVYGLLEGDKARDAFFMFNLTPSDIWKIWELADTRKRGALDRYDFALAMYLIQGVQSGRFTSVPPTTPPQVYEQIRVVSVSPQIPSPVSPQPSDNIARPRKPTRPPPPPKSTPKASPLAQSSISPTSAQKSLRSPPLSPLVLPETPTLTRSPITAKNPQKPTRPPPSPLITSPTPPQAQPPTSPQKPRRPPPSPMIIPEAQKFTHSPTTATSAEIWDISSTAKATAEREFDAMDSLNVGYLEGDVLTNFMLRFQLAPEDLAQIWDLADLNKDQRLTREEFVVAIHLIEQRLQGAELPYILPPSMIPPSLRTRYPNTPLRRSATSPYQLKKSPIVETRSRNATVNGYPALPPKPTSPPSTYRHSVTTADNRAIPPKWTPPNWNGRHSVAIPAGTYSDRSPRLVINHTAVTDIHHEQAEFVPDPQVVALERYQALEQDNLRLSAKVQELSVQISSQPDPLDESEHVPLEQYQALEKDNFSLSSRIKELSSQIAAQSGIHDQNVVLTRENNTLLAKILEMEQITSDVLQSNEAVTLVHRLEMDNADLKRRIAELEPLLPQLEDRSRRVEIGLQENRDLSTRLRVTREVADLESHRAEMEMEDMRKNIRALEQDNENLRNRAHELQQTISKAPSTSSTNPQEMEILMHDVTRENENLKERIRQMEQSTANLLLSTRGQAEHERLRRANQLLTTQVRDLEQLMAQLQQSSEEQELQRVLKDVTTENEQLKGSLRELRLEVTQFQQTARQVEPLRSEVEQLKAEIRRLHAVNAQAQLQDESSVPPPAYEDDPFH
ncbi:hypothetical protein H0H87_005233 [Tephrocybe sp. NHM501043]|nr:hypothetical protein H0H87_005233 [Tephrocybe sp. NHM501043]